LGFFKRLVTPDDEKALVDGCRVLVLGNEDKALRRFEPFIITCIKEIISCPRPTRSWRRTW
jgi:hypothetical protein